MIPLQGYRPKKADPCLKKVKNTFIRMQAEKGKFLRSYGFTCPFLCKWNIYNTHLIFSFTLHTWLTWAHFSYQQRSRNNTPVKGILFSYMPHRHRYRWGSRHGMAGRWGARGGRKPPSLVLSVAGWSLQNGLLENDFWLVNWTYLVRKAQKGTSAQPHNTIFAVQFWKLVIHP